MVPLRRKERIGTQLEPPDISHPDGKAERGDELDQPFSRQGGEVVKERVCDGHERKPAIALRWGFSGDPAETVVLPPDVGRASGLVHDHESAIERTADDARIAEERTEDDLELHRIR